MLTFLALFLGIPLGIAVIGAIISEPAIFIWLLICGFLAAFLTATL